MPPGPVTTKSYKIKKTDSAATVPGRVTFPQGSYVSPPTSPLYNYLQSSPVNRVPYAQMAGTQASGVAGVQGVPQAMYPGHGSYTPRPTQQSLYPGHGSFATASSPASPFSNYAPLNVPFSQLPRPGFAALPQLPSETPSLPTAAQTLAPGQYMTATGDVKRGAAPFGTNAFGERLDASGDVWNPETATRDIYGGRFIQPGETRWERNRHGRLVKVQFTRGGGKRIIRGGKNQSAHRVAQRNAQQAASYSGNTAQRAAGPTPMLDNSTASAFVSFRA